MTAATVLHIYYLYSTKILSLCVKHFADYEIKRCGYFCATDCSVASVPQTAGLQKYDCLA